jgi:hypothetical protein
MLEGWLISICFVLYVTVQRVRLQVFVSVVCTLKRLSTPSRGVSAVAYLGCYKGGPRPRGLGDGSPPVRSWGEAPVGGLGKLKDFLQIYT